MPSSRTIQRLEVAANELKINKLPHTAAAMSHLVTLTEMVMAIRSDLDHTSSLSRMAMMKAVEAELKSERLSYVDVLLKAKRKVTGSGTAGFVMDMAHAALVIASVVASGGASLGLAVSATVVKGARNNANVVDTAFNASSMAEGKKGNIDMGNARNVADVKSAATTSDHAKANTGVRAGIDAAWLASNRIKSFKEEMEQLKKWYDYTKKSPPVGTGDYALTQVKRKTTAWMHHGEGGTFAIEHDFCVALGKAYVAFLRDLAANGDNASKALLARAEEEQSLAGPHVITKHILWRACRIYQEALTNRSAAYAGLMTHRGDRSLMPGYSGTKALDGVSIAARILSRETESLKDFSEIRGTVEQQLNL